MHTDDPPPPFHSAPNYRLQPSVIETNAHLEVDLTALVLLLDARQLLPQLLALICHLLLSFYEGTNDARGLQDRCHGESNDQFYWLLNFTSHLNYLHDCMQKTQIVYQSCKII